MSKYEIDKNIPFSEGSYRLYPFDQMEPGDSLFDPDGTNAKNSKVYRGMISYGTRRGWKVRGRAEDSGFRVWRIA
jgi:hypothetical protein